MAYILLRLSKLLAAYVLKYVTFGRIFLALFYVYQTITVSGKLLIFCRLKEFIISFFTSRQFSNI